jgi:gliding motility-associated-like protein
VFQSAYGDNVVHAIDVTHDLDPTTTNYTLTVAAQPGDIYHRYTEFYLYIAYDNPTMDAVSALIYLNDVDSQSDVTYHLTSPYAIRSTQAPVALATVAGYLGDALNDCERLSVNGTQLGLIQGGDFNSASDFGTSGTFAYANNTLTGLGDDNADQPVAGADALSDVAALVPDSVFSLDVRYQHCPNGLDNDNHLWMFLLTFGFDPCTTPLAFGADTALCVGDTLLLEAERPNASYLWQNGSTAPTFTVTQDGTYRVQVTGPDCTWADTVAVHFDAVPVFDLGPDTTICDGTQLMLSAASTPAGTVRWDDGSTATQRTVLGGTTYSVIVTNGGCAVTDSIAVGAATSPVVDLGPDRNICGDSSVVLDVDPGAASVLWSNGSNGTSVEVDSTAQVDVLLDLDGCFARDTVNVVVRPLPLVELGPPILLCGGQDTLLDVTTANATYHWGNGSTSPLFLAQLPGVLHVTITVDGCAASDSVVVSAVDCEVTLVFPNVFTPNGDAQNALFEPVQAFGIIASSLIIYDRWGLVVYEAPSVTNGWDGTTPAGLNVPEGTYFWQARYTTVRGEEKEQHGTLTLLR